MNVNFLSQHGQESCDRSDFHTGATVSVLAPAAEDPLAGPPRLWEGMLDDPARPRVTGMPGFWFCAVAPNVASAFCCFCVSLSWMILANAWSQLVFVGRSGTHTMNDLILLLIWKRNCSPLVSVLGGDGTSSMLKSSVVGISWCNL